MARYVLTDRGETGQELFYVGRSVSGLRCRTPYPNLLFPKEALSLWRELSSLSMLKANPGRFAIKRVG